MTQISANSPFAIGGAIELPWDAAGVDQKVRLELLDDQGEPVMAETDDGAQHRLRAAPKADSPFEWRIEPD